MQYVLCRTLTNQFQSTKSEKVLSKLQLHRIPFLNRIHE